MKFRKLRIAWSVAWCFLAVLLIALWVRSWSVQNPALNYYGDELKYKVPGERFFKVFSNRRGVRLMTASWQGWSVPVLEDDRARLGFGTLMGPTSLYVRIPHWFLVVCAAAIATAPWFRWSKRFSLRTLLIATTLLAMLLGLAVWATRT
jgi:hypothetical protein